MTVHRSRDLLTSSVRRKLELWSIGEATHEDLCPVVTGLALPVSRGGHVFPACMHTAIDITSTRELQAG